MSRNLRHLSAKLGLDNNLLEILSTPSRAKKSLSLDEIAEKSLFSVSALNGTLSFYDFLKTGEAAPRQRTCQGTACRLSRTDNPVPPEQEAVQCCGYCYAGSGIIQSDAEGNWRSGRQGAEGFEQPPIPVYSLAQEPVLTGSAPAPEKLYRASFGSPEEILSELKDARLRGRGGAGFDFSFKCRALAQAAGKEKYIVCNADEGDPGAFSDRYLLEKQPHKVMAGMYAAGVAGGASTGILYIRHEYPEAIIAIGEAIADYEEFSSGLKHPFRFHLVSGAGSYVCGEETALLNSIEGLRPEVRVRPPYPATSGLWGKPTLVSNVETFANIPWILTEGGKTYAAIGSEHSKGVKLISLDSRFSRPGLYEVDFGHSFHDLIFHAARGFNTEIKALQVGGPLGSVIPTTHLDVLSLDFESFQQAGFALGHAGVIAIPESCSMLEFMRHIFSYMAEESCGKCTPCRLGTAKGSTLLNQTSKQRPLNLVLFEELLDVLEAGSLCALGGGLPLPMRNILHHFQTELAPFIQSNGKTHG